MLPPNASAQEQALQDTIARLGAVPTPIRGMWDPNTCPEHHLPWLAWAFSVDEWNPDWTAAQKRAVIRASFNVHKHKGTVGALRTALNALGYDIELLEWYPCRRAAV